MEKNQFLIQNLLITVRLCHVTAKAARKMLVLKMLKPRNVERKLVEQNLSTKAVYELPFKVTIENKLRCFQYKVIHNILPTNSNLYKTRRFKSVYSGLATNMRIGR